MKTGIQIIADERERQINVEGWTAEHDDTINNKGQLADAAACYAMHPTIAPGEKLVLSPPDIWPWKKKWWKPTFQLGRAGRIKELAKAGALIAAEIDRLQRLK